MKYMGSKRWMLANGLGTILQRETKKAKRFVDLFGGAAFVSAYVAERIPIPVLSYDLQQFSVTLARSVLARTKSIDGDKLWKKWKTQAQKLVTRLAPPPSGAITRKNVLRARRWCAMRKGYPILRAYGGHYFSPEQATWIQALRNRAPKSEPQRSLAIAALLEAASRVAAAPGHTAQPFQPTKTAKKYLKKSWDLHVGGYVRDALKGIALRHAKTNGGGAFVGDANVVAKRLRAGDLVFVDPPYSAVHYSRFYHVLETIARGHCREVSGVGRYPAVAERPRSRFSVKTESRAAMSDLLKMIGDRKAAAIVTFPDAACSNGLSATRIKTIASKWFSLEEKRVSSQFSTLGGTNRLSRTNNLRDARHRTKEMILILRAKDKRRERSEKEVSFRNAR